MITTTSDRHLFIGGSEANMIYMNYETKTFKNWWSRKLTGLPEDDFTNKHMAVGTILEHEIIDLYESVNQVKGIREKQAIKGFARANTDYVVNGKVSDVKATGKAFEWFINEKVPISYKRQLIHYLYVLELEEASIIAYQVDDETLDYPFDALAEDNLFEIPVRITQEDIEKHRKRIEFLEHCRDISIFPGGGSNV